ncbi:MAG: Glycosyl transferase family 4 [Candidatus Moranbacteria bacterium GW2011_GWE1_49_15]|nr:MAG: Glycosyl transferase family 4 [Candidatus Moranbacteria bacterium GW2011_GWE2_47_10]KKW07502.1 MAG: Glycosyl transferase family 4 [Candidatus Moranbacteria bacterium GW2011_GWE1_49_15]
MLSASLLLVRRFFPDDRRSGRHVHKAGKLRLGGVAVIIAFVASLLLDESLFIPQSLWGIIAASVLILIVGVWDDIRELNWKYQLFFQFSIAVLVFIMGVRIEYVTNPFGGVFDLEPERLFLPNLLLVAIWIMIFMNSMNWIDGIDGLSGGITLIGATTIFILALKPEVNQPPVGIITAALFGAVLAFLVFNFNPSRIMAGTSGSMFMGFILAVLAIFAGAKIATMLLIMAIPIIDAFWVILERIKNGKSIFEADRNHLHHKLLELGWSQKKICLFFYAVTFVISLIALNTRAIGKFVTILLAAAVMASLLYVINRKVYSVKSKST